MSELPIRLSYKVSGALPFAPATPFPFPGTSEPGLNQKGSELMPEQKASERRLSAAEKRVKALELKREGKDYREIARLVGWRSPSSAHDAVMKGLRETMQEPADELRQVEGDRLDWLWRKVVERMDVDHLWAVDRGLKIMERRAALLGLEVSRGDTPAVGSDFLAGAEARRRLYEEQHSSADANPEP